MSDYPWDSIAPPLPNQLNGRIVIGLNHKNFMWAVDANGRCLLVLMNIPRGGAKGIQLPRFLGISMDVVNHGDTDQLRITLLENTMKQAFFEMCSDLIANASDQVDPVETYLATVQEAWRWFLLFQKAPSGLLSAEKQKGLLGELHVLNTVVAPVLGWHDAIACWQGPLGAPKDFNLPGGCLEVKTRSGAAAQHIKISSEAQLDTSDVGYLALAVVPVEVGRAGDGPAMDLASYAREIKHAIMMSGQVSVLEYLDKVAEAGLNIEHDYSEFLWLLGDVQHYRVEDHFPRVEAKDLRLGVSAVRYSVHLPACEAYEVEQDYLRGLIEVDHEG